MDEKAVVVERREDHLVAVCSDGLVLFHPIVSELPDLRFGAPGRAQVQGGGRRSLTGLLRRVFGKIPAAGGRAPIRCACL